MPRSSSIFPISLHLLVGSPCIGTQSRIRLAYTLDICGAHLFADMYLIAQGIPRRYLPKSLKLFSTTAMASAYIPEQIDRYLDFISIPQKYHRRANPVKNIEYLKLSKIPYENLSLHYSKDHKVSLDPQRLYNKILLIGRGGYCMENSIFFNHILRGFGFEVYTADGRVRKRVDGMPHGDFMGWYGSPKPRKTSAMLKHEVGCT